MHFSFVGGMEKIKQHTFALAHYTYNVLSTLKYANGAPVVRIYSDTDFSNPDVQGPIINFNILDENGEVIGFSQVCFSLALTECHISILSIFTEFFPKGNILSLVVAYEVFVLFLHSSAQYMRSKK